ncbi:PilX N-terminal domain-containing pilus assembly protein [Guyparkeria sp. 1SP6A2]|nr:PilX N-terminal domain-containing pilus assembly protein [Guyparkeria sp. 1SP6A2]
MTNRHKLRLRLGNTQRGMATVFVAIILLIAATLIAFFTARSGMVEQQITANEIRSKQALAAAEAGIQDALWTLQENGISGTDITPATNNHGGFGGGGEPTYRVRFCDPTNPGIDEDTCPATPNDQVQCTAAAAGVQQAIAASCGWSDDRAARHLVTNMMRNAPSLPGTPTNPVTTKGSVNVTGNVSVANYFNNLTIWTGETLNTTSATGKTFIRQPSAPIPENPNFSDPDSWADYTPPEGEINENFNFANCSSANFICGTQKDVQGPDVIDSDTSLAGLSDDELFLNYFGTNADSYRDTVVTSNVDATSLDDGSTRSGEVIWVDGDLNGLPDLGTRTEPVILIVDGNLDVSSNPQFNGVLYVRGDIQGSGTPRINGALVAEGTVNKSGGNIEVLYDPLAVGLASRLGSAVSVPGTWRDW